MVCHGRRLSNETGTIPLYHSQLTLNSIFFYHYNSHWIGWYLLILQMHWNSWHRKKNPTTPKHGVCAFFCLLTCRVLVTKCKRSTGLAEACEIHVWMRKLVFRAVLCKNVTSEFRKPWRCIVNKIFWYLHSNQTLPPSLSPQTKYM